MTGTTGVGSGILEFIDEAATFITDSVDADTPIGN